MKCPECGNDLPDNSRVCDKCGKTFEDVSHQAEQEKQENRFNASGSSGETALASFGMGALNSVTDSIPGPGKVIVTSLKSFFSSIAAAFKNPKHLIPAVIIAVIWLVLNILQSCGINPLPTQILSFLTFANGGMTGGVMGAIGGIIGKGLFAGAVGSIVGLILNRKKGSKSSVKGIMAFDLKSIGAFILGTGIAVFFFLFISWGSTRMAFMAGAVSCYLAVRSVLTNGFMMKLTSSFTSKGKTKPSENATGFVKGIAAGSAISSLLGLINVSLVLIILGSVLLVGGIVLIILQKTGVLKIGKEADAK